MKTIIKLFLISFASLFQLQTINSQIVQEWVKKYNGPANWLDNVGAVTIDDSGNIFVTGRSQGVGTGYDFATIKYNSLGEQLWVSRYQSWRAFEWDEPYAIVVDNSGNVYVTGIGNKNYTTIKYNSDGIEQWKREYFTYDTTFTNWVDYAYNIDVDHAGNVYVTGESFNGVSYYNIATVKYNTDGVMQWVKLHELDYPQGYSAKSIKVDLAGNIYVAGYKDEFDGVQYDRDYVTIKYNFGGDVIWLRQYGGFQYAPDEARDMVIDDSGNVYVTGDSYQSLYSDSITIATVKYDSSGTEKWVRRYYGPGNYGNDLASAISIDKGGNVIVAGITYNSANTNRPVILKYSSSGTLLWSQINVGQTNNQYVKMKLDVDEQGNIYYSGNRGKGTASQSFVTTKISPSGTQAGTINYSEILTQYNQDVMGIAVDESGHIIVAGYIGTNANPDFITIKYSSQFSTTRTLNLRTLIEGFYNPGTDKMIKDTARVYLRNTSSPYSIVDSSKAVLDSNGNGIFVFDRATNGTLYYIVVKHRNSVDTWSSSGQSFTSNTLSYDFATAADKAYGANQILKGNRYCIYSGDVNRDGSINLSDVIAVNNDLANFVTGFKPTDLNGDNQSDLFDLVIAYNNSLNFITAEYPGSLALPQSRVVKKESPQIKFELRDNYPNPFNPKTKISYELRVTDYASLKVVDIAGKEVAALVNEVQDAGSHSVIFDASSLSSGVYFYKLESDGMTSVKKMMVVK